MGHYALTSCNLTHVGGPIFSIHRHGRNQMGLGGGPNPRMTFTWMRKE